MCEVPLQEEQSALRRRYLHGIRSSDIPDSPIRSSNAIRHCKCGLKNACVAGVSLCVVHVIHLKLRTHRCFLLLSRLSEEVLLIGHDFSKFARTLAEKRASRFADVQRVFFENVHEWRKRVNTISQLFKSSDIPHEWFQKMSDMSCADAYNLANNGTTQ